MFFFSDINREFSNPIIFGLPDPVLFCYRIRILPNKFKFRRFLNMRKMLSKNYVKCPNNCLGLRSYPNPFFKVSRIRISGKKCRNLTTGFYIGISEWHICTVLHNGIEKGQVVPYLRGCCS